MSTRKKNLKPIDHLIEELNKKIVGAELLIVTVRPFDADSVDPQAEIVGRAVELVAPTSSNDLTCRIEVAKWIRTLRAFHGSFPHGKAWTSLGRRRQELTATSAALNRVMKVLNNLSRELAFALFDVNAKSANNDFLNFLTSMARKAALGLRAVEALRAMGKEKGAPPRDYTKLNAARAAYDLLKQFSSRKPTKTAGGDFYELATILYEGGTGTADASLELDCRRILETADPR